MYLYVILYCFGGGLSGDGDFVFAVCGLLLNAAFTVRYTSPELILIIVMQHEMKHLFLQAMGAVCTKVYPSCLLVC